MADTYLNVVDGDDTIIGRQLRSIIHRDGLRHREVHVWFVTKDNKVVFQRRSATKDTYPNHLTATVGGHVEEEQDYMAAALAECREETGVEVMRAFLLPLAKIDLRDEDKPRNVINCVYRMVYLHKYKGEVADLKVESKDGAGFEVVPLADIVNRTSPLLNQLVPSLLGPEYAPVWQAMRDVLRV